MIRKNREILKSYILLVFAAAALIQVGILWNYQNHGLPFNFITAFFQNMESPASSSQSFGEEYFVPYRMVVSGGSEQAHWIVSRNNEFYDPIRKDATLYLGEILKANQVQVRPVEEWLDAVGKSAFIIEFKTNINQDILAWLLGIKNISPGAPAGVYKMAILPWEEDINNTNTVYILDEAKVYKYILPFQSLKKDAFENILKKFEENAVGQGYSVAKDLLDKTKNEAAKSEVKTDFIRKDLLFSATGYEQLNKLVSSVPGFFSDAKGSEDIAKIEEAVLSTEKAGFDSPAEVHYPIEFKNVNNIYRVYREGLMEYRYISTVEENEKSNLRDAYKRALEFVNSKRRNLTFGADEIFLSGVEAEGNHYKFTFDYRVNGLPVFFDYRTRDNKQENVNSAIYIRANNKRVLECWWALRKFEKSREEAKKYNARFTDLLDEVTGTNKQELNIRERKFFIEDINFCYEVKIKSGQYQSETLSPVCSFKVIDEDNRVKYYNIQMKLRRGE